jgi:hypothetical protein
MRLVLPLLVLAACAPLPEAPEDLDELTRYLFREWDDEDHRVMEAGIRSFEASIGEIDFDGDRIARSFDQPDLDADDVADIDIPDGAELSRMIGVGLGRRTAWEPVWHAEWATVEDQAPAEPSSTEYERNFIDPEDPSCFPERECESIITMNHVLKSNALYTAWIDMWKNFRWIDVVDDNGRDTGRDAIVAKVWIEQAFAGEAGNTWIFQTYALDVWLDSESEGPIRLQANWSQTSLSDDETLVRPVIRMALDQLMEQTDETIADTIAGR